MPRGISIHIGVNHPANLGNERPLQYSEPMAWRMAGLAQQAGFGSILALRGAAATRKAVSGALSAAADALERDDTLLVTFSGHGGQTRNLDFEKDAGDGGGDPDECWCLADGDLWDDDLAGLWGRFRQGVRVVVVSESCYSAGVGRDDELLGCLPPAQQHRPVQRGRGGYRDGGYGDGGPGRGGYRGGDEPWTMPPDDSPCVAPSRRGDDGIGASVLLLSASCENQKARDGLFSRHLLHVWDDGAFRHSYCALFRRVQACVMREHPEQQPQILVLGAADPAFPLEPAFHLGGRGVRRSAVVGEPGGVPRGGWSRSFDGPA